MELFIAAVVFEEGGATGVVMSRGSCGTIEFGGATIAKSISNLSFLRRRGYSKSYRYMTVFWTGCHVSYLDPEFAPRSLL